MRCRLRRQHCIGNELLCDLHQKRYYCYHCYSFYLQLCLLEQVPDHLRSMHLLRHTRHDYSYCRKCDCYIVVLIYSTEFSIRPHSQPAPKPALQLPPLLQPLHLRPRQPRPQRALEVPSSAPWWVVLALAVPLVPSPSLLKSLHLCRLAPTSC